MVRLGHSPNMHEFQQTPSLLVARASRYFGILSQTSTDLRCVRIPCQHGSATGLPTSTDLRVCVRQRPAIIPRTTNAMCGGYFGLIRIMRLGSESALVGISHEEWVIRYLDMTSIDDEDIAHPGLWWPLSFVEHGDKKAILFRRVRERSVYQIRSI